MSPGGLDDAAIARELGAAAGWERDGEAIRRTWRFADFKTAMIFVNGVAALAEKANHGDRILLAGIWIGYIRRISYLKIGKKASQNETGQAAP